MVIAPPSPPSPAVDMSRPVSTMSSRRGHRKSRYGCAECKKRHIKCDEMKPSCANCSVTGRNCSFASTTGTLPSKLKRGSIASTSSSPSSIAALPILSPAGSIPVSPQGLPEQAIIPAPSGIDVQPANLIQLQLLHDFSNGIWDFPIKPIGSSRMSVANIVAEGLSCDYLMNEILAFSARRLAFRIPEKRGFYIHHAKSYQTHALALFTRQRVQPTKHNSLGLLFFSWLLGTHMLCDVGALDEGHDFLHEFLQYFELYRGVQAVTTAAWQFLLETEHGAMFQDGANRANNTGTGDHTSALKLLIRDSLGMDEREKMEAQQALARIQWVFDLHEEKGVQEILSECFRLVFSWPLTLAPVFVGMVQKKRPEALLILANFAVVLHWCGCNWIFRHVGSRLFASIISSLGLGWERWLEFPKEMIERDNYMMVE